MPDRTKTGSRRKRSAADGADMRREPNVPRYAGRLQSAHAFARAFDAPAEPQAPVSVRGPGKTGRKSKPR